MTAPITAYIDFASPYSYFLLEPLKAEADRHGRRLVLRPILLWAVLKEHGLTNPLETPLRRAYFMQDVVRSAAFFGKTFHPPEPLQFSAHLAAQLPPRPGDLRGGLCQPPGDHRARGARRPARPVGR